ncbi:MAG TPA: toll/interleukin-1 receptor domain-containing protein, partial [Aggregatilineales bacterium]|nr:toll/interleukin-1 receptor domain-containing protein [Aggregatilineales bacterium]
MAGSTVFISYRRRNKEFVRKVNDALRGDEREVWIDWEDIPPGSLDFQAEIQGGIDVSDVFVPVLSPDYLESEYCLMELDYAYKNKKRLVPIVFEPIDASKVPPSISHINWVYFTEPVRLEDAYGQMQHAMDADFDHINTHTRLLVRAREWM